MRNYGIVMNGELIRMWKEAVITNYKESPQNFVGDIKENYENPWSPDQDFSLGPPEHEIRLLPLTPWHSVQQRLTHDWCLLINMLQPFTFDNIIYNFKDVYADNLLEFEDLMAVNMSSVAFWVLRTTFEWS
jgi:hypothetical protein